MKFKMIKTNIKHIATAVVLACVVYACTDPETFGYLSDEMVSKVDTIFVSKGISSISKAPAYDFSTRPYKFSFASVKTSNGSESTQMLLPQDVRLWIDAFVPRVDITEAQVMAKLKDSIMAPIVMNPLTGVFQFTTATQFVDEDDVFDIDLLVSNIAGEKILRDYVTVKLVEPEATWDFNNNAPSIYIKLIGNNGEAHNTFGKLYDTSLEKQKILDDKDDLIKITFEKPGDPKIGVKVFFQVMDEHGNAVHSEDIWLRPWGNDILPHYGDNSTNTVASEQGYEYNFPMVPWPIKNYMWDAGLSYYISETFPMSMIDTTALFSDARNEIALKDRRPAAGFDYKGFSLSLRPGHRMYASGTWRIQYIMPAAKFEYN